MIERIREKLSTAARWFDVIEEGGTGTSISFKNSRIHSVTERQNSGYGIRVNVGRQTGFSYTNDRARIDETIARAIAASEYGDVEEFDLPAKADVPFEPYDGSIRSFSISSEIAGAENAIGAVLEKFPAANIGCSIGESRGSMRIVNSNGIDQSYKSSHYAASLSARLILSDGAILDIWESVSACAPRSFESLAPAIIDKLEKAREVKKLTSGSVPVVLSPKAFSSIIDIVLAGLNAKSVFKGISPFGDKIRSAVFAPELTISDDPGVTGSPYSYPFDDEGVNAGKKFLVNRGRIEQFITDLKYAHKLNLVPGGNGRRGFSSLPYPSYSNIIIDGGSEPYQALLKQIKRGIMVDQFIGLGQSNTLTGDFSAGLDLAYLIENGEIAGRVKDCMLSDNLFTLLAGTVVFSSEQEQVGSVLAPYLFLPRVTFTG